MLRKKNKTPLNTGRIATASCHRILSSISSAPQQNRTLKWLSELVGSVSCPTRLTAKVSYLTPEDGQAISHLNLLGSCLTPKAQLTFLAKTEGLSAIKGIIFG